MTDLNALAYTDQHEWIAGDVTGSEPVTIGITDYAADQLGDIVYIDLPAVGTTVAAGDACGEIESTKSVGELFAPAAGEIVEVNQAVIDDPSLVNASPFDDGWLLRIRLDGAVENLLDRAGYQAVTGGEE